MEFVEFVGSFWSAANAAVDTPIAKSIGAGLVVYIVYRLGLRAYGRQKDSEHIRARLIDGGMDLMVSNLDYMLSVHRHNWQMMLRYLKLYRDAPATVRTDAFFNSVLGLDSSRFQIVCAKRVTDLLNEPLIWVGNQKVYSFVTIKNDFIVGDFGSGLRAGVDGPLGFDKNGFVTTAQELANEMTAEADELYVFLSQMAYLASLADLYVKDRRSAEKFRSRKDVKEVIAALKLRFGHWTEEE